MTLEILQSKDTIYQARKRLIAKGLSCLSPRWKCTLARFKLLRHINVGDPIKSWDVSKTIDFINQHLSKESKILDMGAYASEVLAILHKSRYKNLVGVDLNPDLPNMMYNTSIEYRVDDLMETPFTDASFDAITSISVIEHGYNKERLCHEVGRLLRPGGYFIASFDYWQKKIDTSGIKLFGLDWNIFSECDVKELLECALDHQLSTLGPIDFHTSDKVIHYANRDYTFAWLVLKKHDN